jgi:hypothetical protein
VLSGKGTILRAIAVATPSSQQTSRRSSWEKWRAADYRSPRSQRSPFVDSFKVGRPSARHRPLIFLQAFCDWNSIYIMMNSMQPLLHVQGSILECGKSNGSLDIRLRWINDPRA